MPKLVYTYFSPKGLMVSKNLSNSSRLVIVEAEKHGVKWKIIPGTQIVTLTYKGIERSYYHQLPSSTTAIAKYACNNKKITSNLLQQAGIKVAETELKTRELQNGKSKIRIVQEEFPAQKLVKNRLRNCSASAAKEIARAIIKETVGVFKFNQNVAMPKYGIIVGVDFKPDNVAIDKRGLVYLDTFSPHIRSVKDPKHVHPVFERYFDRQGRLLSRLTKGYLTETVYDPKKRMITIISLLSRARPELKGDFLSIARNVIREQLPKEQADEILKSLRRSRVLFSGAIGKGIGFLGKRKGKNIQV